MSMVRVTFRLDDETVRSLRRTAERLRLLNTFDKVVAAIPRRPARQVERELRDIRAVRRRGGRRSPSL
jgi:hypothetical protein